FLPILDCLFLCFSLWTRKMITRELMVVVKSDELIKALDIVSEGGKEIVDVMAVSTGKRGEMKCYLTRNLEYHERDEDFLPLEHHERDEDFLPLEHWEEVFSALEMMDWWYGYSKKYATFA